MDIKMNYPLDQTKIKAWATEPEHRERARAFGLRLIQNQDAAKLATLPPLGEFEDLATLWAIRNPTSARLLLMQLLSVLK